MDRIGALRDSRLIQSWCILPGFTYTGYSECKYTGTLCSIRRYWLARTFYIQVAITLKGNKTEKAATASQVDIFKWRAGKRSRSWSIIEDSTIMSDQSN